MTLSSLEHRLSVHAELTCFDLVTIRVFSVGAGREVVLSPWLVGKLIFVGEVMLLVPIEAFVVAIVPGLTALLLFPLTVYSSLRASAIFQLDLRAIQRAESIKHGESGFLGECHVEHVHIRLGDAVDTIHHDSGILSQKIAVEVHLSFNRGTEVTSEVGELATEAVLTDVRRCVVGLAESNFVAGSDVGLLVQVFSSMCEGALVSELAVSSLPILAELRLLFLLVGRLIGQVKIISFSRRG